MRGQDVVAVDPGQPFVQMGQVCVTGRHGRAVGQVQRRRRCPRCGLHLPCADPAPVFVAAQGGREVGGDVQFGGQDSGILDRLVGSLPLVGSMA